MRILMVTPYFPPHVGGMENFVYKLSNRLYEIGFEVEVLTTAIPSDAKVNSPYRVKRVKPGVVVMRNPLALSLLGEIEYLKKFDIIHAHDEHAFTTNIAALTKKKHGRALVVHSHGLFYPEGVLDSLAIRVYNRTLGKWSLKSADKVIALSRSDGRFIENLGVEKEKIEIIPNAIDPADYDTSIDPGDFIEKHGLNGWKVVLYVGAIIKRKGLNYLIKAIYSIKKKHKVKLLVVGKGKFKKECEELVEKLELQENVVFLGRIPREDLMKAYKTADVFALPSLVEGVPTVILESYLYGKPVVAFDIPEIAEYFSKSALLVPPGDFKKLANAIEQLFEEPEKASNFVKEGRNLLSKAFSWSRVTKDIVKVYENLLAG